jgi:hypothetical protein
MTDSDPKPGADSTMEVSEGEVEALLESESTAQAAAAPGPAPPPLPVRPKRFRPRPVHIIGFIVLCAVLGVGIGFLWNVFHQPPAEQASPAAQPQPPSAALSEEQAAPAEVEIRLDELVVTSGDDEEEARTGDGDSK